MDMPTINPREFSEKWIAAWNALDLEGVLAHYTADAVVHTPVSAVRVPGSNGIVRGQNALRDYWGEAIQENSDLHFELVETMATVDGATILYRNHRGQLVAETVLWGEDGLVHSAFVAYGSSR